MAGDAKVVLITGCSTGIGRGLAEEFASRGHGVIATARKPETLADLAGGYLEKLALDVTDTDSIRLAVEAAVKKAGRIDVVVNNAGFAQFGPIVEVPLSNLRRQLETNTVGPLAVVQAALPHMKKGARIVNVGSVSGVLTTPFAGAYCASKAALHMLSDAMRVELAPFGIEVVTVQPGAIRSNIAETGGKYVADTLPEGSRYTPIRDAIEKRVTASQVGAMDARAFARVVVDGAMANRPPTVIRAGKQSFKLPFLQRNVPTRTLDRILSKMFGLDRL